MPEDPTTSTCAAIAAQVRQFYETHPYPPPVDDLAAYAATWDDARRRFESHLFWPAQPYRDDRSVLIAGCGTAQAARYAIRWPNARVAGIDVSTGSLEFEAELKRKHGLANLELHELAIEDAGTLGGQFDLIVCTGVLHHLADPSAGLRALASGLDASGAMHVMVYAPYGRAGVYLLQEYCRRLGIEPGDEELDELVETLKALPADHAIVPLLQRSPDFASRAGLADALLHPNDRAYSVPQFIDFLSEAGLAFGRWVRQAPYLAACGAIARTPHAGRLRSLPSQAQFAAMELFRGTMPRHSAIVYRSAEMADACTPDFSAGRFQDYVPIRAPETILVRERLPQGAAAVAINRHHTNTDLYLPVDDEELRAVEAIDGTRTAGEVLELAGARSLGSEFFERLWQWDQIVFDSSREAGQK